MGSSTASAEKSRSRSERIPGPVLDMMLKVHMRCARKQKGQAGRRMNESEFWGNIRCEGRRMYVAFGAMAPAEMSWTGLQRGREKTSWVWCHDSRERNFKEEGAMDCVRCSGGLGNTMTENCPWTGVAKLWVIPRAASVDRWGQSLLGMGSGRGRSSLMITRSVPGGWRKAEGCSG